MQIAGIAICALITLPNIKILDWYSCVEQRIQFVVWERRAVMEVWKTLTEKEEEN